MFMELKKCEGARVINPNLKKSTNVLLIVLVAVISNTWAMSYQRLVAEHASHVGHFVAEEEAAVLASDQNIRLAMIPCNFSTQINCIYAKHLQDFLSIKEHQNVPEIVVSWVPQGVNLNKSAYNGSALNFFDNSNREKPENDFFNFNWIFELLPCMILASAFEICLLVVRNLRSISLALWGFWSIFIEHLEKLCYLRVVAGAFKKSDNKYQQHRKRNVPISEKRTLSYIFAILTWRASQTAKGGSERSEPNLKDDLACNAVSYGPVTTMGDLLLLILFTHVYYQRQKFLDDDEKDVKTDPEQYVQVNNEKDHRQNFDNKKLYDKHQINDRIRSRRVINKRCSHFCGNTYQQISLFQQQEQQQLFQENQVKLPNLNITSSFCPLKLFYKTHCCDFECFNCCLCPYTCHSCYICLSNCRRCFKSLKAFHDYCCCFQCCCGYQKAESYQKSSAYYLCCRCQIYCQLVCKHCCSYNVPAINSCFWILNTLQKNHCCFYNAQSNNSCSWPLSFLYTLQKNHCCFLNAQANHSNVFALKLNSSNCSLWKLTINKQNYSLIHDNSKELWSVLYAANGRSMILYKPNYYQNAMKIFSSILPQNLINLKHYSTVLKWQKLQLAVMIITLIVISNSKAVKRDNHSHYYNSMFHRCHKHLSKKTQNKRRRRRKRRRYRHHQYGKMYRPQHYFYTTLIQCVKRQKSKKLHKKFLNKLPKKTAQHLKIISTTYEFSLNAAVSFTTTKVAKMRAIKKGRGSKTNIVWLLIGLIWFEGPKLVNCNVLINYQNQQQQHDQQQQQPSGNVPKETATNGVNTNMEYSNENFQQIKTKNNNNSNSNSNNKSKTNKNSNNTNNDSHNTSSNTPITTSNSKSNSNLHLSVNLLPIINTKHFKHYCKNNYYQKLIRSSSSLSSSSYSSSMQRVQRALKTNQNLVNSLTSTSASHNNIKGNLNAEQIAATNGFQNMNEEGHAQSDLMRLESIKHQILFKLGLTRKPNVSHPLPKQYIWDTIYRADGIKSFNEFSNSKNFPEQHQQDFITQQSSSYWPAATTTTASLKVVPASYHQTRQKDDSYENFQNSQDFADGNTKRSLESKNYGLKSKQQLQQPHSKHFNNDIAYQQEGTAATKKLNELFYTTNRNKFNYTNTMINNFTILKQSKHQQQQQQFHKNSQHSTITIHQQKQQQNRKQHEQFDQYTNNNNNNNNKNNYNNKNNINNSNNNINNIIMVQKHLRNNMNINSNNNNNNNNNKYIEEEAKKFTYLTDINSSKDDSLNNMNYHSPDFDDNNSILRKETHHHHHHHEHYNQNHDHHQTRREKVSEHFQHLNIDMEHKLNLNLQHEIINKDQVATDNNEADNDDHQHHRRHDNDFSKLDTYDENDDFFGSTQEIITFAEKGKMYKNHRLVEFSHQNQEKPKQKLHVRNAEIHIRIDKISIKNKSRAGSGIKRKRLKIWIFQLIENNYTYKGFDHVAQFCASFEVDTSRLGWKKFDITTTVKEWYTRREGEKLRLLIDCTGCGKMYSVHLFNGNNAKTDISVRERRIADERSGNSRLNEIDNKHFYNVTHNYETPNLPYNQSILVADNQKIAKRHEEEIEDNSSRPFLVLHTEARRQRRVRRRAINCNGALHGQCCKESFYVSFKALGWDDWIIAPRGYFANYCRGDCTGPYRTPDTFQTFHAHFIEEYRKMGLLNGMQPCCAPIKFSSMSLIYYGDEGIIKRDLPKMVVDECGCP